MTITTSIWIGVQNQSASEQAKTNNGVPSAREIAKKGDTQIDNELVDLERRVKRIAASSHPSVVAIGQGSGVIVSDDGIVLTVAHVSPKHGRRVRVNLSNGKTVWAEALGTDPNSDIAALRLFGPGPWPAVSLGDSKKIQPGDRCVALGYPKTFKHGQPSFIRVGRVQKTTDQKVTTTCTLMGGDSGGALFDTDGRLVAINHRIKKDVNQNLHIPINIYLGHWESLMSGKGFTSQPADQQPQVYLGISGETDADKVRITRVHVKSPADKAGLKVEDVITQVNGQTVASFAEVLGILNSPETRAPISIDINRFGTLQTISVPLNSNSQPESSSIHRNRSSENADRLTNENQSASELKTPENDVILTSLLATSLQPVVTPHTRSIVEFKSPHGRRSLGVVVSHDGLVVAKYSELVDSFSCTINGETLAASIIGFDDKLDLALVKLESSELVPISFPSLPRTFEPGTIVISIGTASTPVALGVLSAPPQQFDIPAIKQPAKKFGIRLRNKLVPLPNLESASDRRGLEVTRVTPRTVAEQSGLLVGDLIESFNGATIESPSAFKNQVDQICIGQKIEMQVWRNEKRISLQTVIETFGQKSIFDQWGGGPFSQRRFGFGQVLPHDSRLRPDDCGGLLVDLDGNIVGMNLARSLRVATFALSVDEVKTFVLKFRSDAALSYDR